MISSGRLSDRKMESIVDEDGHCGYKCPFFRLANKDDMISGATCFNDAKDIEYYDGFLAHCSKAESMHIK